MGKRILYILATVLEVAFVIGAFVLDHFAHAKLGMNRWLVHRNGTWERDLPLDALQVIVIVVLLAVVVAAVVLLVRRQRRSLLALPSVVAAAVLLGVLVWFCLSFDAASLHAYYLMALCLVLACAIQVAKAVVFAR